MVQLEQGINRIMIAFLKEVSPVSANVEKGGNSLSLPSESSAMVMRPLMRSTWVGW